ncbi:hypothetical protein [Candidatus Vidania fulgoroideorum]
MIIKKNKIKEKSLYNLIAGIILKKKDVKEIKKGNFEIKKIRIFIKNKTINLFFNKKKKRFILIKKKELNYIINKNFEIKVKKFFILNNIIKIELNFFKKQIYKEKKINRKDLNNY